MGKTEKKTEKKVSKLKAPKKPASEEEIKAKDVPVFKPGKALK